MYCWDVPPVSQPVFRLCISLYPCCNLLVYPAGLRVDIFSSLLLFATRIVRIQHLYVIPYIRSLVLFCICIRQPSRMLMLAVLLINHGGKQGGFMVCLCLWMFRKTSRKVVRLRIYARGLIPTLHLRRKVEGNKSLKQNYFLCVCRAQNQNTLNQTNLVLVRLTFM